MTPTKRMTTLLNEEFERARGELTAYLCRLVVRPQVADDLVQTTWLRCFEARERLPDSREGVRAWLFKVASNLAFDELRRHATWREVALDDLRSRVESDADFLERSRALAGTPETRNIAREHLVACLACKLRNLPTERAAAVLLKEVHGFSVAEIAELLDASFPQVKNWLQAGRAFLQARYGARCALVTKAGVCHQCEELDARFAAGRGEPLPAVHAVEDRYAVAVALRDQPWGAWHRLVLDLLDDLT